MKISVVVLSDPKQGDEALGRLLNALALAHEAHEKGDDVQIVFQGAGTRWPDELARLGHPAQALYDSLRTLVSGASRGCSLVFGATEGTLADHTLPNGVALGSLRRHLAEGRQTLLF